MKERNLAMVHEVAIVYPYLHHYREPIFRELCLQESPQPRYTLFSDTRTNVVALNTISSELAKLPIAEGGLRWSFIRNFWLGKVFLWQQGAVKVALDNRYDSIIFLGSMYYLSTWLSAWLARRKGKRVLMWTHGLYHNERGLKGWLRRSFYRLSDGLLLYGNRARGILIGRGFPADRLYVVFNSLDHAKQVALRGLLTADQRQNMRAELFSDPEAPVLIFIGRLTQRKKVGLLLEAVAKLSLSGRLFNVLVVGDGPSRDALEKRSTELGLENQVRFYGSCHEEEVLARLFQLSDMSVSPGWLGLMAMHAMAYGVPVLTHDDPTDHSPEFEAVIEGETGAFFRRGDVASLAETLVSWCDAGHDPEVVSNTCQEIIDRYYNPSFQAQVINGAVKGISAGEFPLGNGSNALENSADS